MTVEMRRLVFSDSEVTQAINEGMKAEWSKIQVAMDKRRAMGKVENLDGGGSVLSLALISDDPLEFKARIKSQRGAITEREFSSAEMMHLLIAHCRIHKIPLARAAKKTLRKAKVGYALDLTIRKWSTNSADGEVEGE
ncbi:MAG: hypothetical protein K9H25_13315 [Rhodospirillum sp.]|nr:hypothetical protein [Rhodospirillum sp.]MCF8490592.1 hypothetical protein [Rhodospirillum sp.]MCF8498961.1 hypothetical protein [Rhodospirillum sp.]